MRLELATFPVEAVELGDRTELVGRTLLVSAEALARLAGSDPAFHRVTVELVRPGEAVRVTQLSDVVEPRVKVSGGGEIFPGFLGPVARVGDGRTHRLDGVTVMTVGEVPWLDAAGLFLPLESTLDTAGPGALRHPYARKHHVVLRLEMAAGHDHEAYQRSILIAGLKAARYLAETTRGRTPAEVAVRETAPRPGDLPTVLYACQVQSQGVFMRSHLYGRSNEDLMPTLLDPNELYDGALVAGGIGSHAAKLHTWMHQNNPIVAGLHDGHGIDWSFGGVIVHRGHYYLYEDKQRVALQLVRMAEMAGAHGVLFTVGGIGNSITEVMLALQECEQRGIKTVLLAWESGGRDGTGYPLPFVVPEAVAIVSTGSIDERVALPAMERIVGAPYMRIRPEVGGERYPVDRPLPAERSAGLAASANPVGTQATGCVEL